MKSNFLFLEDKYFGCEANNIKGTFFPPQDTDKNIRYLTTPHGRYQLFYNGYLYNRNMSSYQKT